MRPAPPSTDLRLTEGPLGPHQAQREGDPPRLLLQHLGHLVVATADDALLVDGLDVVAHTHAPQPVHGAALLDSLQDQRREE